MAGLVQKFKDMWNPPDDEVDYVDDQPEDIMSDEEEHITSDTPRRAPARCV